MDEKEKIYLDDKDLTEADRVILRLYEKAADPLEWDQSDEAILAFAKSIHGSKAPHDEAGDLQGRDQTNAPMRSVESEDSIAASPSDESQNVVEFAPRDRRPLRQFHRSPLAGLAIAATLLIGVVTGQGLSPYVDFGVAPEYTQLLAENERLTQQIAVTRSLQPGAGPVATPATGLIQVTDLLENFSCANLSVTLAEGREIRVAGRVSSLDDMERLQSGLSDYNRFGRVTNDVDVYGRPFCEVLDVLESRSRVGAKGSQSPAIRPANHGPAYRDGEHLVVQAVGTNLYEGYIYVDIIQGDGQVVHMLPFDGMPDNLVGPGERILLGAGPAQYALGPPYGMDLIMVISTPVPLFDRLRDQVESVDSYLPALTEAPSTRVKATYRRPSMVTSCCGSRARCRSCTRYPAAMSGGGRRHASRRRPGCGGSGRSRPSSCARWFSRTSRTTPTYRTAARP